MGFAEKERELGGDRKRDELFYPPASIIQQDINMKETCALRNRCLEKRRERGTKSCIIRTSLVLLTLKIEAQCCRNYVSLLY